MTEDNIYFERILNGKAISISHSVNDGKYGGKYIIMWNSEKNMVESYFFSTGGEIILSKATISVDNITIEEDFSKNGNRIKKVKKISKFPNGVLIKFPKKRQDLRVDLPTVGLETLKQCKMAGLKGIVLKHKLNIFLNKSQSVQYANRNKMFILIK